MLDELLNLLSSLSTDEWTQPTACAGWSVHDVALHLLGGDVGILSRQRDSHMTGAIKARDWDDLVAAINQVNEQWVQAARRISPRLLCDLLKFTGDGVNAYFHSLDPYAIGGPVSWAGPERAPVWLDLAREYTERWHHQQHIRDAVGKPGLTESRYLAPALDTFVRALPHAFRDVDAGDGAQVCLTILGPSGGSWTLVREQRGWRLFAGQSENPAVQVKLSEDIAWRTFTKGLSLDAAREHASITGDDWLGEKVLQTVALIA